jgi:hypothetical protein
MMASAVDLAGRMSKPSSILCLCVLVSRVLFAAAEAGQPGGYLRAGVGARAAALGNAYTALAEGPEAAYWNPAGLAWSQRPAINTMVSTLSLNRQFNYAGVALAWDAAAATGSARQTSFPAPKGFGNWGLGWLSFSLGNDFEGRTDDTASFYTFGDQQDAYLLSYGRALFPWWSLGVSAKAYEHRLDSFDATGGGLDVGTLLLLGSQVRFGLQAQDLASQLNWSTGYQESFPLTLRADLAAWAWKDRLLFSGQLEQVSGRQPDGGLGLEVKIAQVLAARLGWEEDGLTLGGGISLEFRHFKGNLDYAYLPDPLLQGNAQRISLEIAF